MASSGRRRRGNAKPRGDSRYDGTGGYHGSGEPMVETVDEGRRFPRSAPRSSLVLVLGGRQRQRGAAAGGGDGLAVVQLRRVHAPAAASPCRRPRCDAVGRAGRTRLSASRARRGGRLPDRRRAFQWRASLPPRRQRRGHAPPRPCRPSCAPPSSSSSSSTARRCCSSPPPPSASSHGRAARRFRARRELFPPVPTAAVFGPPPRPGHRLILACDGLPSPAPRPPPPPPPRRSPRRRGRAPRRHARRQPKAGRTAPGRGGGGHIRERLMTRVKLIPPIICTLPHPAHDPGLCMRLLSVPLAPCPRPRGLGSFAFWL